MVRLIGDYITGPSVGLVDGTAGTLPPELHGSELYCAQCNFFIRCVYYSLACVECVITKCIEEGSPLRVPNTSPGPSLCGVYAASSNQILSILA
jgi:hypothetical protein